MSLINSGIQHVFIMWTRWTRVSLRLVWSVNSLLKCVKLHQIKPELKPVFPPVICRLLSFVLELNVWLHLQNSARSHLHSPVKVLLYRSGEIQLHCDAWFDRCVSIIAEICIPFFSLTRRAFDGYNDPSKNSNSVWPPGVSKEPEYLAADNMVFPSSLNWFHWNSTIETTFYENKK